MTLREQCFFDAPAAENKSGIPAGSPLLFPAACIVKEAKIWYN